MGILVIGWAKPIFGGRCGRDAPEKERIVFGIKTRENRQIGERTK